MIPVFLLLLAIVTLWLAAHLRGQGASRWLFGAPVVAGALAAVATGDLFVLRKVAGLALMPPALLGAAVVLLTAWAFSKTARRLGAALAVFTAVYFAAGNVSVGGWLLSQLEAPFPPLDLGAVGELDAIYLLGGGTAVRPDGAPAFGASGDRVFQAARCFKAGLAPHVVTGGMSVAGLAQAKDRDMAEDTQTLLMELGVPAAAIVRLKGPRTTEEEMKALAIAARTHGWRRIGLVTSAWHLRRTMLHADRAGLNYVPIPADFRGRTPVASLAASLPSGHGFYLVRLALWEYLGALLAR